jgi:uncharacterized membrane protein YhdT
VSAAALVPVLVLAIGILVIGWIYRDATQHAEVGTPVVARVGSLTVDTPTAWVAGCLVLSVIFIPLYLVSRT